MNEVKLRIQESRRLFLDYVWPLWAPVMSAVQIISTEDSEYALEREADRSGTDAFMVRHDTGVMVPLASRIEFYDSERNDPFKQKYWDHYPRFTIRLAKQDDDGTLYTNVECRKRLAALNDPISRRYLPLYTFQTLIIRRESNVRVLQSSRVQTDHLYTYVQKHRLDRLDEGTPSRTRQERDVYRIITVEKLRRSGIEVALIDNRISG